MIHIFLKTRTWIVLAIMAVCVGGVGAAKAADPYCFCGSDLSKMSSLPDPDNDKKITAVCLDKPTPVANCNSEAVKKTFPQAQYLQCVSQPKEECQKSLQTWKKQRDQMLKALSKGGSGAVGGTGSGLIYRAIPSCVFEDKLNLEGECGSVSVFITLLINLGNAVFAIIGAIALAAFIYGGFLMILSQGNPDKIQQGKDAMVAAAIGLAVAFGGYFLVRFLGEAIGLKSGLNLQ